ncbi:hypothetical protein [Frankia gtarii]|uniref:hypothetical protein n=1 Tax=Frankia gtarii TaxID=2950102 RepID=UPI0021C1F320
MPAGQPGETRPDTIIVPAAPTASVSPPPPGDQRIALHAVTTLITAVVALSFLFGLGNVWALGIRLGVPACIAPLVAPAVDLSVVALLVATRQLALAGASRVQIRPAQRLLIFCSLVTLSLNVAEPLITGRYGRAAFDAVGPLLLIGWAEVAPDLFQAMQTTTTSTPPSTGLVVDGPGMTRADTTVMPSECRPVTTMAPPVELARHRDGLDPREQDLLHRARAEDVLHWQQHQRPISAETLRKRLHVGTNPARTLVAQLRADSRSALDRQPSSLATP